MTQIEGDPSVTITATPAGTDLGALTGPVQQKLDGVRTCRPA